MLRLVLLRFMIYRGAHSAVHTPERLLSKILQGNEKMFVGQILLLRSNQRYILEETVYFFYRRYRYAYLSGIGITAYGFNLEARKFAKYPSCGDLENHTHLLAGTSYDFQPLVTTRRIGYLEISLYGIFQDNYIYFHLVKCYNKTESSFFTIYWVEKKLSIIFSVCGNMSVNIYVFKLFIRLIR